MPSRRRTQRASRKSTKAERKSEVNSTLKETNIRRLLMSCGHFKRQCAFKLVTIGLATQNWRKSADNQNKHLFLNWELFGTDLSLGTQENILG